MQLGVLVDAIDTSQKSVSTILSLNKLVNIKEYWDAAIFFLNFGEMIIRPKFALMNMSEICGFRGASIATDLKTAEILINTFGPSDKYFYVWDLEWTLGQLEFKRIQNIYMNPDIKLIARSDFHAREITKCWRKPHAIIENFNNEEIIKYIKE